MVFILFYRTKKGLCFLKYVLELSCSKIEDCMTKACSLDFLNKTEFDTDVLSSEGAILYEFGAEITPEILLKLYFKDIYIPKKLEFDEEHAKRVRDYAEKLGELIGMSPGYIDELKEAAYYHDIGRIKFSESDLKKKDFARWQGEAGVNILANERQFPKEIAEVASLHLRPYNSAGFPLIKEDRAKIPFAYIVSIANSYDELRHGKLGKKDALLKMVQLGGDKFNIFLLHKFVRAMRESDG